MPPEDFSVVQLAAVVLKHRWTVLRWAFAGGVLAFLLATARGTKWTSHSSFARRGGESPQNSLRSLAGQFGFQLPAGSQGPTPRYFEVLLRTHALLGPIAEDTFTLVERDGERRALSDMLRVDADLAPQARRQQTVRRMVSEMIATRVDRESGIITLLVTTQSPSVSLAITERLLTGLNEFNLQSSRTQASEERRFTEGRLDAARRDLQGAEARLLRFLQANRQYQSSPELRFEHDRMDREVNFHQQLVTSLAEANEEVRIREARDTPVITVIEPPQLPARPNARRRAMLAVVGGLMGGILGTILMFLRHALQRQRERGEPSVAELGGLLAEARSQVLGWVRIRQRG